MSDSPRQRVERLRSKAKAALFKATGALLETPPNESALVWSARAFLALAEIDSIEAGLDLARRVVESHQSDVAADEVTDDE